MSLTQMLFQKVNLICIAFLSQIGPYINKKQMICLLVALNLRFTFNIGIRENLLHGFMIVYKKISR